ncbi:glycosyltransferase [Desulfovibrio cuneatus]|uniref:glycosyltransferase n=1 Tax=Desulfovibrio cuneatus TaxID=159728 RepID=UPI0003FF67A3|nr:glycosyltransferase [Desulfovibrio cuneatus]
MNQPLISIIMPAYNAQSFIASSIASVIAQTWPHWELLIIDDGSTDGTASIAAAFALQDSRIQCLSQENAGVSAARNLGMQHAQGPLLSFLDADDLWAANTLQLLVQPMLQDPSITFVHGTICRFDNKTFSIAPEVWKNFCKSSNAYHNMLMHHYFSICCLCFQKSLLNHTLQFNAAVSHGEDRDFFLHILPGVKVHEVKEAVAYCRLHANNASLNAAQAITHERAVMLSHIHRAHLPEAVKHKALSALEFRCAVLAAYVQHDPLQALRYYFVALRQCWHNWNLYLLPLRKIRFMLFSRFSQTKYIPPEIIQYIHPERSKQPLVSLLIATVGRIDPLVRLLKSLQNQTYTQFEILLADQNPSDFLAEALAPFEATMPIMRISLPSTGVSAARNALVPLAKGDIIAFPDDDCWYAPKALASVVSLLQQHQHALGLVVGWNAQPAMKTKRGKTVPCITRETAFNRGETYTQFYRKEALANIWFDPELGPGTGLPYGCGEDTDFLLQVIAAGAPVSRTSDVLVYHPEPNLADPALPAKAKAYALGRMHLLRKHKFPLWFKLANVLYPLLRLPLEGKKAWPYRKAMFMGRIKGW